ncbi:MAG TPA: macro domain-containing protein [Pseudonocardiaceae bacterium]|jgi:O-acetyl-ADP-ribose deacetylase (regulator of RNase III)
MNPDQSRGALWSSYRLGKASFHVGYGDLTESTAEALVSSDDNYLTMGGGVSRALSRAGGGAIAKHARKLLPLKHGEVVVTTAGELPAKYIFHATTIDLNSANYPDETVIEEVTRRALELADTLGVRTVGFPALGTGTGGFPFHRAANAMVETIAAHLSSDTGITEASVHLRTQWPMKADDLAVYYQRATSLAASAGQTRRLFHAAQALDEALVAAGRPELSAAVQEVLANLATANDVLAEQPENLGDVERIQDESNALGASRNAVELIKDEVWDDRQVELKALRTRVEGLSAQLNIHYGSLNRLEIDKARYGGIGVPLILENQISVIQDEVRQVEAQMREARAKLAEVAGR